MVLLRSRCWECCCDIAIHDFFKLTVCYFSQFIIPHIGTTSCFMKGKGTINFHFNSNQRYSQYKSYKWQNRNNHYMNSSCHRLLKQILKLKEQVTRRICTISYLIEASVQMRDVTSRSSSLVTSAYNTAVPMTFEYSILKQPKIKDPPRMS